MHVSLRLTHGVRWVSVVAGVAIHGRVWNEATLLGLHGGLRAVERVRGGRAVMVHERRGVAVDGRGCKHWPAVVVNSRHGQHVGWVRHAVRSLIGTARARSWRGRVRPLKAPKNKTAIARVRLVHRTMVHWRARVGLVRCRGLRSGTGRGRVVVECSSVGVLECWRGSWSCWSRRCHGYMFLGSGSRR